MLDQPIDRPWKKVSLLILGLILTATGLALLGGGLRLLMLGGSIYFAPAGLALTVSGVLTILRKPAGGLLYLATFVVTVLWALSTSAFALWPLISDLMAPAVLAVAVLLLMPAYKFKPGRSYKAPRIAAGVLTLGIIATFVGAFQTQWIVKPQDNPDLASGAGVSAPADENWAVWGGNAEGTRFSSLT